MRMTTRTMLLMMMAMMANMKLKVEASEEPVFRPVCF